MILLILLFVLVSSVQSCKEVTTDCNGFDDTKFTIDQVIADINQTLKESHEFFVKYETDLHTFAVQVETKLRTDKILLERLLKLQERHGREFANTREFDKICDEHVIQKNKTENVAQTQSDVCESLGNSVRPCENCTVPLYDSVNMIYTCTKEYAFDVSKDSRQVRCDFSSSEVQLVYEGNGTSGVFNGTLECLPLSIETVKQNNCSYTCAETAECSDNKLVCACLKGYADVSAQYDKPAGSICTKCRNSQDHPGKDFVMLFDKSYSVSTNLPKMQKFLENFLDFIQLDESGNRFSLITFGTEATVRFPLEPKTKKAEIVENVVKFDEGAFTSTALALQRANDEVYAKLPLNSTRPRVTILFTDGEPDDSNALTKLQGEVGKMRETYKAQIITIYIGRITTEKKIALMRAITSEDEELSVEHFEDLKETVLDRLQTKIC